MGRANMCAGVCKERRPGDDEQDGLHGQGECHGQSSSGVGPVRRLEQGRGLMFT